jgi:hypothetical protein
VLCVLAVCDGLWLSADPQSSSLPVGVDKERYHSLLPLPSDQTHPSYQPHAVTQMAEYKALVGTSAAHAPPHPTWPPLTDPDTFALPSSVLSLPDLSVQGRTAAVRLT